MKKSNLFVVLFFFLVGVVACDNSLEPFGNSGKSISNRSGIVIPDTVIESLDFIYKGEFYHSMYASVDDSIVSIFDTKTNAVWERLNNLQETKTYIHSDGNIEYFDNQSDLEEAINKPSLRMGIIPLPVVATFGSIQIFDDVDYKDRNYKFELWGGVCAIKNLKTFKVNGNSINFNDKTSSLKLVAGNVSNYYGYNFIRFVFWEDDTFSGRALVIDLNGESQEISNLKKIKVAGSSKNWNDRISSFETFAFPRLG